MKGLNMRKNLVKDLKKYRTAALLRAKMDPEVIEELNIHHEEYLPMKILGSEKSLLRTLYHFYRINRNNRCIFNINNINYGVTSFMKIVYDPYCREHFDYNATHDVFFEKLVRSWWFLRADIIVGKYMMLLVVAAIVSVSMSFAIALDFIAGEPMVFIRYPHSPIIYYTIAFLFSMTAISLMVLKLVVFLYKKYILGVV